MRTVVIIPARMMAKRVPGKPMRIIDGQSIIHRCFFSVFNSDIMMGAYVASSDSEILWEICKAGGSAIETSGKPINGTERVAEAARILQLAPDDIVVNLQGDMPFFDAEIIDEPVKRMKAIPECQCASVMTLLAKEDRNNPNRIKVIIDNQGRALSFSRDYIESSFLHIGVYVFRNSFLQRYAKAGPTESEIEDNLEQQRVKVMKERIWMSFVNSRPVVIDSEEDLIDAQK